MSIDISKYSFQEWLDFTFKCPVDTPWIDQSDWTWNYNAHGLTEYLTRLFRNPEVLIDLYSKQLINKGLWFISGHGGYSSVFVDPNIEWSKRKECIESMYLLFQNLFGKHNIGSSCYMWWDSIMSYCATNQRNLSSDMDAFSAILDVVIRIARLDSQECHKSAIHGIKHMRISDAHCKIVDEMVKAKLPEIVWSKD